MRKQNIKITRRGTSNTVLCRACTVRKAKGLIATVQELKAFSVLLKYGLTLPGLFSTQMYTLEFPVNTKESEFENIPFLKFSPNLF